MGAEERQPEVKTEVRNSISRIAMAGLLVIAQIAWIIVMGMWLSAYSVWIYAATVLIALVLVIKIYVSNRNTSTKMPWIMLILSLPLAGIVLYVLVGHSSLGRKTRKRFEKIGMDIQENLKQEEQVLEAVREENPWVANQCRYISNYGHYPVYSNTDVVFYDEASDGFEAQLEALKTAQKFIFMEYHAIEEAISFGRVREILKERAAAGVEVRIIYDDVGSIGFINWDFIERMRSDGIQCHVFNPVVPSLNLFMNNRDHRKLTVIDGEIGFVGGYNLADEYFNIINPYGRWKDSGVRITGDAVKNLTATFWELWSFSEKQNENPKEYFAKYFPDTTYKAKERGFVQPYADSPLDGENVGESVYLNIIKNAKDYVYFTTPYLIITDEMNREFELAAKRGVDVRIITPGIPDKKVVFSLTRSYYAGLACNGVRIYEYTPGFCHAKQCVSDGQMATVGTINLDYRSLYQHFENGVFFYGCDAVEEVRKDFDRMFPVCQEVTEKYSTGRSTALRVGQCILRLFAPLL